MEEMPSNRMFGKGIRKYYNTEKMKIRGVVNIGVRNLRIIEDNSCAD